MQERSTFLQRYLRTPWPGRLARRRARRRFRRMTLLGVILLAAITGVVHSWPSDAGTLLIAVGRELAGLGALGMAGLIIGVVLTALTIFLYNGLLNGPVSLLDLEYIDEIPLLFALVGGVAGIFLSVRWPDIIGLVGWGMVALVLNESLFRRPGQ
ncbi:MAG TPA: hypothetical protein ENI95_09315 [Chloroflexi bacterium]|nr:hypothetical protein [Chloroflexota bacterium]